MNDKLTSSIREGYDRGSAANQPDELTVCPA
jgi:hypothetical protein